MQSVTHAEECFQRGITALNERKPADAEACFREAIEARPDCAEAHSNLGVALAALGRHAEALATYERALRLRPDFADAHHNLANSLRHLGRNADAIEHLRTAVRLKPDWADAHNSLGQALRSIGALDQAIVAYRAAVRIQPDHPDARNNLGVTLSDKGLHFEAIATYRLALKRNPRSADIHNNVGVALAHQGKHAEAIGSYRRSLELRPTYAEAHSNLGNALRHECQFADAEASLREALRLKPEYAEAFNNLAIMLTKVQRVDEAIAAYREALRLKPNYPDGHKNLGLALLSKGDFAAGWAEYEHRWGTKEMPLRKFTQPRWDGSALDGKTILLYAEQGLGDTIQFIRYAALDCRARRQGAVRVPQGAAGAVRACAGIDRIVPQGQALPAFDAHAALMSVPGIVRTDLASIPASKPYLSSDPERIRRWGEELKGLTGYKIGIAWQGSRGFQDDKLRSIPVQRFEPLARLPGVRLISLQKDYGSEQLRSVPDWKVLDLGNRLNDFLDTAAVMKHLDLVVTVDTAVAHLAGALGVPVWIALPTASDWRWLQNREDSPWYASARLFRQKTQGDWAEVLARMARELESQPPLESAARYDQRGLALLREGSDARHNLANVLRHLGRHSDAEAEYRNVLKLMPNSPEVANHLGIALLNQAKHPEAEACFRRSLRLKPDNPDALNNLGVLYERLRRIDDAIACYQECLRLRPNAPDTHKNLALAWLLRGDYPRGWAEYEWRWKSPAAQTRKFSQPRWDGRLLDGEPVLLFAEQGLGDTIQFVRYARMVKERGGTVLVECPGELQQLFRRCPGVDRVIRQGEPVPDFAYQLPFMSLPRVLCTTLETVPASVPYLSADPRLIEHWGRELAAVAHVSNVPGMNGHVGNVPPQIRIGIAWQGSQRYAGDGHRSAPLQAFAPLAGVPGVQLFSLQKGYGAEQLREVSDWNVVDLGSRLNDFTDTAAVMKHLDLVVSVDTAVAHLAGALNVPVWVALCTASDWRWLESGDESAWYPSARLFRQSQWGNWADVLERMADALRQSNLALRPPMLTETAPGELFDRIAILQIKRDRMRDAAGLEKVHAELGGLLAAQARGMRPTPELAQLAERLRDVHAEVRQTTDDMQVCEQREDFGEGFVELARQANRLRGRRAAVKRQIGQLTGAASHEESSYTWEPAVSNGRC